MQNEIELGGPVGVSGEDISLLDILDHVLNAGVVIHGSMVLSIAGVDLVYLGLNVVLTSVETALKHLTTETRRSGAATKGQNLPRRHGDTEKPSLEKSKSNSKGKNKNHGVRTEESNAQSLPQGPHRNSRGPKD